MAKALQATTDDGAATEKTSVTFVRIRVAVATGKQNHDRLEAMTNRIGDTGEEGCCGESPEKGAIPTAMETRTGRRLHHHRTYSSHLAVKRCLDQSYRGTTRSRDANAQ